MSRIVIALLLGTAATLAFASPRLPSTRKEVEKTVAVLWYDQRYAELDMLLASLKGKVTLSGFSLEDLFYQAVNVQLELNGEDAERWKHSEDIAQGWIKASPTSAFARVAYANVHREHAMALRGGDYAPKVTPAQWAGFRKYNAKAKAYLLETREIAGNSPAWYVAMLSLSQVSGDPETEYRHWLDDALERFPDNFWIYIAAVSRYTPRWGGSQEAVATFIAESTARLPEPAGSAMYARLYNFIYTTDTDVDVRSLTDCTRWLKGIRYTTSQFATPYNLNQGALASYLCGDRELAKSFFERVGPIPEPGVWGEEIKSYGDFNRARAWARE